MRSGPLSFFGNFRKKRGSVLKRTEGFTLVEIMTAVSITILLSTIVLVYSHSSERQIILYREQSIVVGIINRAKSLAIQKANLQPGTNTTACAFGVHFQGTNTYILYQIVTNNQICGQLPSIAYDPTNSKETIQTFTLDSNVHFNLPNQNPIDVAFVAPNLDVRSSGSLPVTIPMATLDNSIRVSIDVGFGGQIVTH